MSIHKICNTWSQHVTKVLACPKFIALFSSEARLVKRNAKRKHPREYYKKLPNGQWQGGKDLASSAAYTAAFARALFTCWQSEFNARSAELV